ncbi:hypothetical protein IJJ37_01190 [Candidatus Saccharibacteria bacterium]|nr:hypothetical protein [Candidatus Saccharibacteria bacterium]
MKQFIKKIFLSLAIIFSVAGTVNLMAPTPTYAADGDMNFGCRNFLGLTSWDCGLGPEGLGGIKDEESLKAGIIVILANVLTDMSVIAAYLVLGFVIYGGYLYIFSSGDPTKVQNGKKTILRASIGLTIVTLSNVILNAIRFAFLSNSTTFQDCRDSNTGALIQCIDPNSVITNALQWFVGTAGVVALVFVVIGGIGYVTSAGDATKLQKSKNTILYALIGLVIVAVAELFVSFISGIINGANPA